jgi:hypothetical protein
VHGGVIGEGRGHRPTRDPGRTPGFTTRNRLKERYLVFPGPGSGLPSKKVGDRVFDDPVVDVDVGLLPLELFPLELLDPHPPVRAATTTRAATPSEAVRPAEARLEMIIAVLPCHLHSTGVDVRDLSAATAAPSTEGVAIRPPSGGRCFKIPDDGDLGPSTPTPLIVHGGLTGLTVASFRSACVSFLWIEHVATNRGRHGSHGLDI